MKIKKKDKVKIMTGRDKGKEGIVVQVSADDKMLIVENINIVKRHTKPTRDHQGTIVSKSAPLDASKVMLICPSCSKPTRVGYKFMKNEEKVRICKKCNENIDK